MRIQKNTFLHQAEREVPKECKKCGNLIKKKELVYSKRHKRNYCIKCSILLGFVEIKNPKLALEQGIIVGVN